MHQLGNCFLWRKFTHQAFSPRCVFSGNVYPCILYALYNGMAYMPRLMRSDEICYTCLGVLKNIVQSYLSLKVLQLRQRHSCTAIRYWVFLNARNYSVVCPQHSRRMCSAVFFSSRQKWHAFTSYSLYICLLSLE